MKELNKKLIFFVTFPLLLSFFSCSSKNINSTSANTVFYNKIAVFPVSKQAMMHDKKTQTIFEISKNGSDGGLVEKNSELKLSNLLYNAILSKSEAKVLSPFALMNIVPRLELNQIHSNKEICKKILAKNEIDAYLVATLIQYEDRLGTSYAVDKPASVAFAAELIDVLSDTVIWKGYYREKQKPLNEDLSQIKQYFVTNGKWLSSDELMRLGVSKVMNDFPYIKVKN
ncbi:MAG: hypothetical protein ABIA04_05120 [Pseudomonadota bacterium]